MQKYFTKFFMCLVIILGTQPVCAMLKIKDYIFKNKNNKKLLNTHFFSKNKKNNTLFNSISRKNIAPYHTSVVGGMLIGSGLYAKYGFTNQRVEPINIEEDSDEKKIQEIIKSKPLSIINICWRDKSQLETEEVLEYIINHFSEFKIDELRDIMKKSEKVTALIKQYVVDNMFTCIEKTVTAKTPPHNYPKEKYSIQITNPLIEWADLQQLFPDTQEQQNIFRQALEKHFEIPFSAHGPYTQSEAHILANYASSTISKEPETPDIYSLMHGLVTTFGNNRYYYNKKYHRTSQFETPEVQRKYVNLLKKILQDERNALIKEPDTILLYHALGAEMLWLKIFKTVLYRIKYPNSKPLLLAGHESNKDLYYNGESYFAGKNRRKFLFAHGDYPNPDRDKDIHYTNGAILGNLSRLPASTWLLLTSGVNCSNKLFTEQDIALQFDITLSNDFVQEINQCREKFLKKAQHSFLLRWRIPTQVAKKFSYTAYGYGIKKQVRLNNFSIFPSNVPDVLKSIRQNPFAIWFTTYGIFPYPDSEKVPSTSLARTDKYPYSDTIEYPLILTADSTLIFQKRGVKVDILSINDHDALEEYVEELISIVKKIQQKCPEQLTSKCSHGEEIAYYKKKSK